MITKDRFDPFVVKSKLISLKPRNFQTSDEPKRCDNSNKIP